MGKAAAKPKPSKRHEANVVRGIALLAIQKFAEAEKVRDMLPGGITCDVDLEIAGEIDGVDYHDAIVGMLTVSPDQIATSSSGISPTQLVGILLAKLPLKSREKLLDELPKEYSANKLPEVDKEITKAAKRLLERLRTNGPPDTKRGTVNFAMRPVAAEAASA